MSTLADRARARLVANHAHGEPASDVAQRVAAADAGRDNRADFEAGMDWAMTRRYLAMDFARTLAMIDDRGTPFKRLYWRLMPQFQALVWYRISRWLYLKGWRNSARLLHLICIYLTGAELPPTAAIGPGCVLGHACGIRIGGRVGARLTVFADSGIGGGIGHEDVGGGPGLPYLGDDVTMGIKSMVLGPVRIGDGAKLGPGVIVTSDVAPRAIVFNPPPRQMSGMADAPGPGVNTTKGH